VGYVNKINERKKKSGSKCTENGKEASDYVKRAMMKVSVLLELEGLYNVGKSVWSRPRWTSG
jgi:hypothetical protein